MPIYFVKGASGLFKVLDAACGTLRLGCRADGVALMQGFEAFGRLQNPDVRLRDGELELHWIEVAPHPVHKAIACFFRMIDVTSGDEVGRINLREGSSEHIESMRDRWVIQ